MHPHQPTDASQYLIALARKLVQPYTALPTLRAIVLTGSASEGVSDLYSDLDIILYYDALPPEEALAAIAEQNGGSKRNQIVPRGDSQAMEHYFVAGVECQFGHTTVADWESEIALVLDQHEVDTPLQKALGGMAEAIPLYGEPLVRQWQARLAAYPDALALAMVQHHLAFYPLWGLQDRMSSRDATLWYTQMLVDNAHALIGVLAGLNHLYFSSFQFKRTRRFTEQMAITPGDFADRLEAIFHADPVSAGAQLEALVLETVELVEQHMPQVDTARARRRIGWRSQAWTMKDRDKG